MSDSRGLCTLAKCRWCDSTFMLDKSLIHRSEYKSKESGRSIFLTYYDCPKCNGRHFVQVDDAYSMELLAHTSSLFVRIASCKAGGKKIPGKWQDKYAKRKSHLGSYRTRLMRKWNGSDMIDVSTGQTFRLEFSV